MAQTQNKNIDIGIILSYTTLPFHVFKFKQKHFENPVGSFNGVAWLTNDSHANIYMFDIFWRMGLLSLCGHSLQSSSLNSPPFTEFFAFNEARTVLMSSLVPQGCNASQGICKCGCSWKKEVENIRICTHTHISIYYSSLIYILCYMHIFIWYTQESWHMKKDFFEKF